MIRPCIRTAAALGLLAALAGQALAGDQAKATQKLPGVDASVGDGVVHGDPSGANASGPRPGAGWVKVGDWDVKLSGSVNIDIGTRPLLNDRD